MKKLANEHQGFCLSEKYINQKTELLWKCHLGHVWRSKPTNILRGTWCPECAIMQRSLPIEYYQNYAYSKGGKCLSKKIPQKSQYLLFECSLGHIWKTKPSCIQDGHWCPTCGALKERYTIKDLKAIGVKRNGRCLTSNGDVNGHSIIEWECELGHQWEASVFAIITGWWCPECRKFKPSGEMRELPTIEDMRIVARFRGGKCLSSSYINGQTNLRWQCAKGHEWLANPSGIVNSKTWCPQCAKNAPKKIEDMQNIAHLKGGKCLSVKFINVKEPLKWLCKMGHVWNSNPDNIIGGSWCPECAKKKHSLTIKEMQQLAEERGGKCLSKTYVNSKTKLQWQCAQGHLWKTTPHHIKQGYWCPQCAKIKRKLTIKEMQQLAGKRGGKCLSVTYVNSYTKLQWQCAQGHIWAGKPSNIKHGTWCPQCEIIKKRHTIEEMQQLAEKKGGHCLSLNYENRATKLRWICKEGHKWEASYGQTYRGMWCPICKKNKKKYTIEDMIQLAKKKGGNCLSSNYINRTTKLRWQCAQGHIWNTMPSIILRGSWCPECSLIKRKKVTPKT